VAAEAIVIYLKSFVVGALTAVAAAILWIVVAFVLPVFAPFLLSRVTGGGGFGAATIGSGSILAAALVGFAAGFYWTCRRHSRTRRSSS
jgi:hypothetical protein